MEESGKDALDKLSKHFKPSELLFKNKLPLKGSQTQSLFKYFIKSLQTNNQRRKIR